MIYLLRVVFNRIHKPFLSIYEYHYVQSLLELATESVINEQKMHALFMRTDPSFLFAMYANVPLQAGHCTIS